MAHFWFEASSRLVPMIQSGSGFISLWGLYWILKLTDMGNSDILSTTKCLAILLHFCSHVSLTFTATATHHNSVKNLFIDIVKTCHNVPYGLITKLITRKEVAMLLIWIQHGHCSVWRCHLLVLCHVYQEDKNIFNQWQWARLTRGCEQWTWNKNSGNAGRWNVMEYFRWPSGHFLLFMSEQWARGRGTAGRR